jgi:ABC-type nitrate/sulfonate/bicarbonate transport system permease component
MRSTTPSRWNWPGIAFLAIVALAWELSARAVGSLNYPSFIASCASFAANFPAFAAATGITLARAAAGFAIALVVMLPLGIMIGRMPRLGQYVEPLLDMLRPLPPLAIVPVAMLFAGTGSAAKILVIVYSAAFPLLISAIAATRSTHPVLIQTARSLGLSRWEIMREIDLPAALPQIAGGIRVAVALALLISVSSEMLLSTDGIGNFIMRAQEQFLVAQGLAALVVIALVALAINSLVFRAEQRLLAWHYARMARG